MNWIQVTTIGLNRKALFDVDKIDYIKTGSDGSSYFVAIGGHEQQISAADAEKIFAAIGKRIV